MHLIGFAEKELVRSLLEECARMQSFEHPNIMKLSGVCLDGGPAPYIIMPFMANGSLLTYLKDHRESLVVDAGAENVVGLWLIMYHEVVYIKLILYNIFFSTGSCAKKVDRHKHPS